MRKIFLIFLHKTIIILKFAENFHQMDEIDIKIGEVIEPVASNTTEIEGIKSLRELYDEKKKRLGLSDRQVQRLLNMDTKTIKPILDGTAKQTNLVSFIKIGHFLGIDIQSLARIYVPELDKDQIGEIHRARIAGFVLDNFDIATLIKIGFLNKESSIIEISNRIIAFFGLHSIFDYNPFSANRLYSRTRRNSNDLMRAFWVHSALTLFKKLDNKIPYNRGALVELMPKIRSYTLDEKYGLYKVLKALFNVGVTVIFQPSVEKLQIRGATMCVNEKPCIVISDVNKSYATLWFALMHELHHVLYDFEDIIKQTYHITDNEGDIFLVNEKKANQFAFDYLLGEDKLLFISAYIGSNLTVRRFGKEWCIHPSIIYEMFCYRNKFQYKFYKKYMISSDVALNILNTHPFEKKDLEEVALEIKEILYR